MCRAEKDRTSYFGFPELVLTALMQAYARRAVDFSWQVACACQNQNNYSGVFQSVPLGPALKVARQPQGQQKECNFRSCKQRWLLFILKQLYRRFSLCILN